MATKTQFVCSNCGHTEPKWLGRCPEWGEWSTFVEEVRGDRKARSPGSACCTWYATIDTVTSRNTTANGSTARGQRRRLRVTLPTGHAGKRLSTGLATTFAVPTLVAGKYLFPYLCRARLALML